MVEAGSVLGIIGRDQVVTGEERGRGGEWGIIGREVGAMRGKSEAEEGEGWNGAMKGAMRGKGY